MSTSIYKTVIISKILFSILCIFLLTFLFFTFF